MHKLKKCPVWSKIKIGVICDERGQWYGSESKKSPKNRERAEKIEKQTKELEAKYQSEVERNDSLKKDSAVVDTKEYVVKVAKEKLGLVDRGEVIFKVEH